MRVVHLLRKPLSEKTVAANALLHGTGALNIDHSRIAAPNEEITNHARGADLAKSKGRYSSAQETRQTAGQTLGRWPTHLVFQHQPGCVLVGSTKIKGSPPVSSGYNRLNAQLAEQGSYQKGAAPPPPSRCDTQGMESIPLWDCVAGCVAKEIGLPARYYFQTKES